MRRADAAERERAPGLHRHLPEVDRADVVEDLLHEVVHADRDAARGDDGVSRARLEEPRAELVAQIGHDAEVEDLAPRALDRGGEGEAVRVVDLPGLPRRAGLDDLVAGGQERDARPAVGEDLDAPERREQAKLRGAQHRAALDDDRAGLDVLATHPHVRGLPEPGDADGPPELLDDLLGVDRVGAAWYRRARHDPDGLAGGEGAGEDRARGQLGDDGELARPGGGDVRARHRVAVHGGVVGRRDVERRGHLLREDAGARLAQEEDLGGGRSCDLGEDPILPVLHRDHGDIIRASLRHTRS